MNADGTTRWRIEVDADACQRSGQCTGIAPKHFTLRPGPHSRPSSPLVVPDPVILDAAYCCPAEAITVTNAATGEPVEFAEG